MQRTNHTIMLFLPIVLLATSWVGERFLKPFDMEIHEFSETGRGVRTTRDRRTGETLLEIPLQDTLTATSLCQQFPTLLEHPWTDEQILALGLCHMLQQQDNNLYIQSLPRHVSLLTMPEDLWETAFRPCLPRCYQEFMSATRTWGRDLCTSARKEFDFSEQDILWACSMVRSRSVSVPELKPENVEDIPHALIPGLDLLNHQVGAKSTLSLVGDSWQLLSETPHQTNDQVWLSYGDEKDNWKLLVTYGFCLADNPAHQFLFWDFSDLLDAASRARPSIFTPRIQQSLLQNPQLAVYTQPGEQRAILSYDVGTQTPRESLQGGLALLASVAAQLGRPDDTTLPNDVFNHLLISRQEDLKTCLKTLDQVDVPQEWQALFSSLRLVLEQEQTLLTSSW